MDVGNYISELLAQKGEVSVPGLGYFAHTRVNGHYNEREGKFYPPTYSVQFDPQLVEDDTLAQYIADKKKISPASAKYFTEKYINSLKTQAASEEAALADLGWFYMEQGRLFFSANSDESVDPHFIGYEPVTLHKLGSDPIVPERTFASTTQSAPTLYTEPETIAVVPEEYPDRSEGLRVETDEEYEADLAEAAYRRRRRGGWILAICLIVFTAIAVFLVYRYNPDVFKFNSNESEPKAKDSVINARVETVEPTPAKDTVPAAKDSMERAKQPDMQTGLPVADSTKTAIPAKTSAVAVKDSVAAPRYEIMGGSFKTEAKAIEAIANYKRKGVEAHIIQPKDKRFRISLGSFETKAEVEAKLAQILKTGKIKGSEVYIQPPKIKK